ncbi:hypothetical protein ACFL6H_01330 [Candidatus Latescibacterota bacterium]
MKRRDVISNVMSVFLGSVFVGCAAMEGQNAGSRQQPITGGTSFRQPSGSRSAVSQSGPSDIKSLSEILQRARCPLNDTQVNTLLRFKTPEEFRSKLNAILTNEQLEAVKNASRSSGGRRGGGGRRR